MHQETMHNKIDKERADIDLLSFLSRYFWAVRARLVRAFHQWGMKKTTDGSFTL